MVFLDQAGFMANARQIYYCVLAVDGERDRRRLCLFNPMGGSTREITGSFDNPRSPFPSPDGTRLAFVADVDGTAQLCVTSWSTGTVEVLTDLVPGVVGTPRWSPNGRTIAFTARQTAPADDSKPYWVRRPTFRYQGFGHIEDAFQDVHIVDVEMRKVRRLTSGQSLHVDPRWSPDGRRLLFRMMFPPGDQEWTAKPSAHVIDVESGECQRIVGDWGGVLEADWCPDGERLVFYGFPAVEGLDDAGLQRHDLWTVDLAGGVPVCRTSSLPAGVGVRMELDHPTWQARLQAGIRIDAGNDVAYVNAQRGGDITICRVGLSRDPDVELVVAEESRTCFLADVEPATGTVLYAASTLIAPPDLFLRDGDAELQITRLNDEVLKDVVMPRHQTMEVVTDGLHIDGWALTPPGPGPFPTVLAIHGGPCASYGNVFMIDHHLLVAAGMAVVFSNFRGSSGYGTGFLQALQGRWGEVGERDHLATIDRAIDLGIADPDRIGVCGLSHGGFATCWLLGRTDRFRAGVAENPVVNFISSYGTMDAPWWIPPTLGGRPDEVPTAYADASPLTYAANCTTPLLFIVGEDDLRCLPIEAEQYYRVLKTTGCPTEMLRLPKSDHLGSWSGPVVARSAQNEAIVEWFGHHLRDDVSSRDHARRTPSSDRG